MNRLQKAQHMIGHLFQHRKDLLVIIIIDVMMFIPKMFFHFREKQSAKHVEPKQALKLRLYVRRASLCSIFIFCCSFTAKLNCIPQLIITRRSS